MIRRPPRSTLDRSSAASDVYKRQGRHLKTRIWKGILYPDFISSLNTQLDALGPLNESQKITFAKSAISSDQNSEARKYMPVSYTHLRAHETPEHLVCRLLLE